MARPSSASTPGSVKRKREGGGDTPKSKKSKQKSKRPSDEGRSFGSQGDLRKMDSPAVQRAKREIKIRRLSAEQINALERAFDDADGKLSHPQKVEIAKRIGLEARQVAIWFQNRRAKWRTEQVENQYDVLKQENQRLADENKRLHKELEAMRIALAATRAGIAHPTPSRVEAIPGASGPSYLATKDGESPGSVYDKLQNLIQSMKAKRSALFPLGPKGKPPSSGGTSGSSSYDSSGSEDSSSSEEQQPIQRAKRSRLQQKKTPTQTPKAATPRAKGAGKASPAGKKAAAKNGSLADKPPPSGSGGKLPPKARLQREQSIGQRRGSKLEALKLPVKMSPAVPLFADKDRPRAPTDAPTPKMGGPSKPGVPTPGSTPSMWVGGNLDPSPTTGPLANGSPSQEGGPSSAEALLEQVPPSALGRGFSHLLNPPPQSSPTESNPSPTTYLLADLMEGSPTTGALAGGEGEAGKAAPQKPSPLGAEALSKEAKLQLAPSTSEWGEAMLKAEQQRNEIGAALQGGGRDDELPLALAREAQREFRRSASPGHLPPVQKFPNTAAQDFLAKYRAVYGEINRSSAEGGAPLEQASRAADSLLAFVNGTAGVEEDRGAQQGGGGEELTQRLELNGKSMDALALLNLGGGLARPSSGGNKELELSLDLGSLGHLRSLLAEPVAPQQLAAAGGAGLLARGGASFLSTFSAPQATSSAFDVFQRTGNLLDPYQDPPFSTGMREERALSPSLREAISQHQSQSAQANGAVFLSLEGRHEGGVLGGGGPLTPRLGGQVQHAMPPWLAAVANGERGDSGSSAPGWWTQVGH